MPGSLEAVVKLTLHFFPNGIAMRPYDHAAAHSGMFGKAGFFYDIQVPL